MNLRSDCFFQEEIKINNPRKIETIDCLPFDIYFEKVFKGHHQISFLSKTTGRAILERQQIPHKGTRFINVDNVTYVISIPRADHVSVGLGQRFASIVIHEIKD
ncbi:MAG: hypothetical protein GY829_05100 [Gammaproteobacteria bacterium]|nr:hypothetical protein [Gammaproteobacteria bacterium]